MFEIVFIKTKNTINNTLNKNLQILHNFC